MSTSERVLVQRMAAGDGAAFAEFYDALAPRVFGLLVRMLGQRAEAEDVLQEAFWSAWRCAADYDCTRATPLGWLVMIARSRAIDHIRRRRAVSELDEHGGAADCDLPREAADREARARACGALEQLPVEQREAIQLAYFGGLTHEQIAVQQALPLGTVKTRIRLGMKRLQNLLCCDESLDA